MSRALAPAWSCRCRGDPGAKRGRRRPARRRQGARRDLCRRSRDGCSARFELEALERVGVAAHVARPTTQAKSSWRSSAPPLFNSPPRFAGRSARSAGWGDDLSLYVAQLLGHLAVSDLEQVDASDVSQAPVETPPHVGAIAGDDHLLGLETSVGPVVEEPFPERAHCRLADPPLPIRNRQRVLEDAVVGHQRHHGVDVVPAESLVKRVDSLGRSRCHQPWPIIRAITSERFGPPLPNGTACTRCANTISATEPTWVVFTCSALS